MLCRFTELYMGVSGSQLCFYQLLLLISSWNFSHWVQRIIQKSSHTREHTHTKTKLWMSNMPDIFLLIFEINRLRNFFFNYRCKIFYWLFFNQTSPIESSDLFIKEGLGLKATSMFLDISHQQKGSFFWKKKKNYFSGLVLCFVLLLLACLFNLLAYIFVF